MHASGSLLLGVNVDHVATLRQARGTRYPSPAEAARLCEQAGAHGITVHLREDRRHIQDADLAEVASAISIPLNLEMACVVSIVEIATALRPAEVCLVPERREELTTEGGLNVTGQRETVERAVAALRGAGIEVSLFIDPDPEQVDAAKAVGARLIELHTGTYCDAAAAGAAVEAEAELERLSAGARRADAAGLRVNAGHGITIGNLPGILRIPHLHMLNIGHSIVSRAVMVGMASAVREMLDGCARYQGGDA